MTIASVRLGCHRWTRKVLWRPERLRLDAWRDKRQDWQKAVELELAAAVPNTDDRFVKLERAQCVALLHAKVILGVTGGRLRSRPA
jgi:hypothetical protein